jgi:hypothetical protein
MAYEKQDKPAAIAIGAIILYSSIPAYRPANFRGADRCVID